MGDKSARIFHHSSVAWRRRNKIAALSTLVGILFMISINFKHGGRVLQDLYKVV